MLPNNSTIDTVDKTTHVLLKTLVVIFIVVAVTGGSLLLMDQWIGKTISTQDQVKDRLESAGFKVYKKLPNPEKDVEFIQRAGFVVVMPSYIPKEAAMENVKAAGLMVYKEGELAKDISLLEKSGYTVRRIVIS